MKVKTNVAAGAALEAPPGWLADVIREAEQLWQNSLPALRSWIENLQESVAQEVPSLAALADVSIGPSNIRPSTAKAALEWAAASGADESLGVTAAPTASELIQQILDPGQEKPLVLAILAHTKDQHPVLRNLSWGELMIDDALIAKLYSGYMGAGDAWETWKADLIPGPAATTRLQCALDGRDCAVVRRYRPI